MVNRLCKPTIQPFCFLLTNIQFSTIRQTKTTHPQSIAFRTYLVTGYRRRHQALCMRDGSKVERYEAHASVFCMEVAAIRNCIPDRSPKPHCLALVQNFQTYGRILMSFER